MSRPPSTMRSPTQSATWTTYPTKAEMLSSMRSCRTRSASVGTTSVWSSVGCRREGMTTNERFEESLLNPTLIRDVVQQLQRTDVDELEVSDGHSRLYIRREPGERVGVREASAPAPIEAAAVGVPIVAPLTGVFYSRPSPEQPE